MARVKLADLYKNVEAALLALGLTEPTIVTYRSAGFHPLQRFFKQKKCVFYSRKLAEEFVAETLDAYESGCISIFKYRRIRKVAALLEEYNNTGTIKWAQLPNRNAVPLACKHFEKTLDRFLLEINGQILAIENCNH